MVEEKNRPKAIVINIMYSHVFIMIKQLFFSNTIVKNQGLTM